jgi:hypothetical protein
MADSHLEMTAEEKEFLLRLLQTSLQTGRVEKHHTDAFEYKELVQQEISLIETLLAKLKQTEG